MVWTRVVLEMALEDRRSGVEAAPTASRDDTLPSRARLLFVWFKAPLANPFLRVGICAVRRPHKARRPSPLEHFRALPAHGPRNAG